MLINRTSRGGKGEYVGIGTFYDYDAYGDGHHNQGIIVSQDIVKNFLFSLLHL